MIDIHSHILPGIDDGFKTVEESVAGCRMACEDGIRTIVATPHLKEGFYDNPRERVQAAVAALQAELSAQGVALTLAVGCEVYFAPDLVAGVRSQRIATLADRGRYLLLELPHHQQPVGVENVVFDLKVAGITPVLAHPERISWFQDDINRLEGLIRQGALSQLTTSSLTAGFGSKVEALSIEMVRRGMVHFIASDHHDLKYRPPILSRAAERLTELAGSSAAEQIVQRNPELLLANGAIDPGDPLPAGPAPRSGSFFSRWFGSK